MISDKETQNKETNTKKKSRLSLKIILLLILALLTTLSAFYLYFKNTQTIKMEYGSNIEQIEKLKAEKVRCSNILGQESGNFGDYEYCRRLLQVFSE